MAKRAYKFRFYPTKEQEQLLARTFGCMRFVYNTILRWRTDAFYNEGIKIGYIQANAKLTEIKQSGQFDWLNDVSSVPLQQCLRHQQAAFKNFFEGRAKYPTFKKKRDRQSIELTQAAFRYNNGQLYIAKSKEPLAVRWSQPLPSEPSTITISKDSAERYFISCLCEFEPIALPVVPKNTGIDLGIHHLFVTDSGEKTDNPRHTSQYERKLARMQKNLSRKQPGSKNRAKARYKVARIHAKISDCRLDNLHKLSHRLVDENQVICVESLRIKNMIRNHSLSKSVADVSWGEFVRQIRYKAEWAGRTVVAIDPYFPSSKRCSHCGHIADKMPLAIREWDCPECGTRHDRDINAANNILAAGLAVLACGETVSLV